ncbi:MAG: Holliday junction branch migration protein RuvA [Bacteroidales bacterium]|nr:Holliday junction branch migration protein RuvA [Bacteroidales bacterium]
MYEFLNGKFEEINPSFVVVNCNGVGYIVEISLTSYSAIKDKKEGKIYTHFVVREDARVLYGFATSRERELFRQLISVSGIGANTARMMLSSLSVDELVKAIVSEDSATISKIKGIGTKTSQRVVVDLHDKLKKWEFSQETSSISASLDNKNRNEALLALQTLGFNKVIIEKTLDKLLKEDGNMSVEVLVKEALRRM